MPAMVMRDGMSTTAKTPDPDSAGRVCLLLQLVADRLGHFLGADGGGVVAVGLEVVGDVLSFLDNCGDGVFQAVAGIGFAEVPEHEHAGEDEGGGVDLVLPLVLGSTAVRGFEDRAAGAA